MHLELKVGRDAGALDRLGEGGRCHWHTLSSVVPPFACEDVRAPLLWPQGVPRSSVLGRRRFVTALAAPGAVDVERGVATAASIISGQLTKF